MIAIDTIRQKNGKLISFDCKFEISGYVIGIV